MYPKKTNIIKHKNNRTKRFKYKISSEKIIWENLVQWSHFIWHQFLNHTEPNARDAIKFQTFIKQINIKEEYEVC